ncbi:MAG: PadR family transcriptional regulator [Candidatus Thorarchaeota archaeon]
MSRESRKVQDEFERWSRETRRGAATLAVLAVVDRSPSYGYELVKHLEQTVTFLQLEEGTVYPILRRLEERLLLRSEWNYDDPTKPKKYYRITEEGKRALAMMTETWFVLASEMRKLLGGS